MAFDTVLSRFFPTSSRPIPTLKGSTCGGCPTIRTAPMSGPYATSIRLGPRHSAFFEAAGYQRTEGGGCGDMDRPRDQSSASRAAAQITLNELWTLY